MLRGMNINCDERDPSCDDGTVLCLDFWLYHSVHTWDCMCLYYIETHTQMCMCEN